MAKLPPLPLVLTANALLGGAVVYRTDAGWTESLPEALVAHDEAAARALEAALAASEASGDVVEPYLASVQLDPQGRIHPVHYRERIRAIGPTVRHDLNPQPRGEHRHVSL